MRHRIPANDEKLKGIKSVKLVLGNDSCEEKEVCIYIL